jgi:UDP-N-acetylglucosamine:LPS N-acetylglucosamine transferase
MNQPKKVLILTAKLGGGHRNSAKIIHNWLAENQIKSLIWDITDPLPKVKGKSWIEWFYYLTAVKFPFLWELTVKIGQATPRPAFLWYFGLLTNAHLKQVIKESKPDLIVSTYGHLAALVEGLEPGAPVINIVSDPFTPNFYWLYGRRDQIVVISQIVYDYALDKKVEASRLHLISPMVNPKFTVQLSETVKQAMRLDLGLNSRPTVLIMAGGEGLPKGQEIVRTLLDSSPNYNLMVICGKDAGLKTKLERLKTNYPNCNFHVYGFIDHVYEIMNLADVVISKAGPATILESLALDKPILLTSYYAQEKGNLDFVVNNNYGLFEPRVEVLPKVLEDILNQPKKEFNTWKPVDEGQRLMQLISSASHPHS